VAWQDDVSLMWALRTLALPAPVDRGAEEVCPGVQACCVDVVVLGEVAHDGRWR
jgi:hypothetical protein